VDFEQEFGKYLRLQRELTEAYTSAVCQNGLIERLTDELAVLRSQIERGTASMDEQSSDATLPGLLLA